MQKHAFSHYETVAMAFQVQDIAQPLCSSAPPDWTIEDALTEIVAGQVDYPDNWFCLIRDESKTYGYIASDFIFDDEDEHFDGPQGGRVGDHCTAILPNQIVSVTLPLLDLIPLFRHSPFFFGLARNEITHVVSFYDLDKLPVKLCLFSLLMALETSLIELFSTSPAATQEYLSLLPSSRFPKAQELCNLKYKNKVSSAKVLLCTTFIDKATILVRCPQLLTSLPFNSRSKTEQFFERAQNLRNQIAHSDSILIVLQTATEFDEFITALRNFTDALSKLSLEPK